MKRIGTFGLFQAKKELAIVVSLEDLERIKFIVSKAPQEAQWFHRVQRIEQDKAILYRIHGCFVPEQYCSAAEVETTPEMQMRYWQELVSKYGTEDASLIVKQSGAWCHSHVGMSPNPSGQDSKQFAEHVERAGKDGNTTPQLMLIFNKKDEFYSRLWDPELGYTVENLQLIVLQPWDFTDFEGELKAKFKERPRPVTNTLGSDWGARTPSALPMRREFRQLKNPYLESNLTAVTPGDGVRMAELVHKINDSYVADEFVQDLAKITDRYLSTNDYIAMCGLLYGVKDELEMVSTLKYRTTPKVSAEKDKKEFWALVEADKIQPVEAFERAVDTALALRAASRKEAKEIVSDWSDFLAEKIGTQARVE